MIFSNAIGRFRENYENKHGKALRAIYAARSLAHDTIGRDIAPTVLFKIFDTQIQPIIDYSSEVCYDRKVNHRFESLQTIYLKRALGVKVQTSNLAVFGESPDCKARKAGPWLLVEIDDNIHNKSAAHCIWWTLPT